MALPVRQLKLFWLNERGSRIYYFPCPKRLGTSKSSLTRTGVGSKAPSARLSSTAWLCPT